ncbi:Ras-related protein Rab [Acrasis kona]|uniref:Ras-related protein Rab n=1 Tax=Acrasis kona TaxID=1008807 RepID=A0AAW2YQ48_9EUKA
MSEVLRKLVIAGDSACGKSCLVLRYVENTFSLNHVSTIGLDFRIKMLERGDKKVKLQVWDTAGQERFRAMASSYFRVAQGVIITFDVTNEESFHGINVWMRQIREHAPEGIKIILVGNKIDLDGRVVTREMAEELAEKLKIEQYFETSAKSGENVNEAFDTLVDYTLGIIKSKHEPEEEKTQPEAPETFAPYNATPVVEPQKEEIVVNLNKKPEKTSDPKACGC